MNTTEAIELINRYLISRRIKPTKFSGNTQPKVIIDSTTQGASYSFKTREVRIPPNIIPTYVLHEADHIAYGVEVGCALKGKSDDDIKKILIDTFKWRIKRGFEGPKILHYHSGDTIRLIDLPYCGCKETREKLALLFEKIALNNFQPGENAKSCCEDFLLINDDFAFGKKAKKKLAEYMKSRILLFALSFEYLKDLRDITDEGLMDLDEEEKRKIIAKAVRHLPEQLEGNRINGVKKLLAPVLIETANSFSELEPHTKDGSITPEDYIKTIRGDEDAITNSKLADEPYEGYTGSHLERRADLNAMAHSPEGTTPSDRKYPRLALLMLRRTQQIMQIPRSGLLKALEEIEEKKEEGESIQQTIKRLKGNDELSKETKEIYNKLLQFADLLEVAEKVKGECPQLPFNKEHIQKKFFLLLEQDLLKKGVDQIFIFQLWECATNALQKGNLPLARLRIEEACRYNNDSDSLETRQQIRERSRGIDLTQDEVRVEYTAPFFLNDRLAVFKAEDVEVDFGINPDVGFVIVDTEKFAAEYKEVYDGYMGLRDKVNVDLEAFGEIKFPQKALKGLENKIISRDGNTIIIKNREE